MNKSRSKGKEPRPLPAVESGKARVLLVDDHPTMREGLIRVTVPPTFARLHVVSKLAAFFASYPDLAVDSDSVRTSCADPGGSACQPPAVAKVRVFIEHLEKTRGDLLIPSNFRSLSGR